MLNSAYKKNTRKSLSLPDDLISFGMLGKDNRLTYAGALFADYCPVYNSRLFCTRWSGLSMGAGLIDALDDAEYSSNVLTLVQNGIDFMRKHYKMMWKRSGMLRVEYPDYPQEALREALINALIHRDYSIMGSEVHIDIYDDRIEITSPGGMYDRRCK
jgi:predicted HTH transcriptional regulator